MGAIERRKNSNVKFINLKIKNNSGNRYDFYVIGPKPNCSKFSYGFLMMPYAKRNEHWTVGTKIFKINRLGLRSLLVEIYANDENTVVQLF